MPTSDWRDAFVSATRPAVFLEGREVGCPACTCEPFHRDIVWRRNMQSLSIVRRAYIVKSLGNMFPGVAQKLEIISGSQHSDHRISSPVLYGATEMLLGIPP